MGKGMIKTREGAIALWLFGVVCGAIPPMLAVVGENFDARDDLAEFHSALNEARDAHRRHYSRLSAMEQRVYRRIRELPDEQVDQLADEIPGTWRAMVDKIMRPVRDD